MYPYAARQNFPKPGGYLLTTRTPFLLPLIATCAGLGEVFVLDGGNSFNAYHVARAIRFQTVHLYAWQAHIHIARAFTCHEMTTLLAQTPATHAPVFILDLLATFYDEAVNETESLRLLRRCLHQVRRLQKRGPVFIHHPPSPRAERPALVTCLRRALTPLPLETLMGKTTPTPSDLIREMEAILARFRQVLHPTQRAHLDALIVKAKQHTTAIGHAAHLLPFETILLASLLEQEIEYAELTQRLAALERKLAHLENERQSRA